MKKMPSLFIRDWEGDRRYVTIAINPECQWVINGEGTPRRKYDGTCMMLDNKADWWARREVKKGRPFPSNYVEEEFDDITHISYGWEPIAQSSWLSCLKEAVGHSPRQMFYPGTYELCGPKINNNPEKFSTHVLIAHKYADILYGWPRDYNGLKEYLRLAGIEGVVWHHDDGRYAKIKRKDFNYSP